MNFLDQIKSMPNLIVGLSFFHLIFAVMAAGQMIDNLFFNSNEYSVLLSSPKNFLYAIMFVIIPFGGSYSLLYGKKVGWWCSAAFNFYGLYKQVLLLSLMFIYTKNEQDMSIKMSYADEIGFIPVFTYIVFVIYLLMLIYLFRDNIMTLFKFQLRKLTKIYFFTYLIIGTTMFFLPIFGAMLPE